MKQPLEAQHPALRANVDDRANLKAERSGIGRLPVAKEAGADARQVRARKLKEAHCTPGPIDFAEVNRAALAALPAVLARILPDGKRVGAELVALNPRRGDRHLGSFKINLATAVGRTSRLVTRAAIRFPSSLISPTSRKARRRGC